MSESEVSKASQAEIIKGTIVPESLRYVRNQFQEDTPQKLPPSVIAKDGQGRWWFHLDNVSPTESFEEKLEKARKLLGKESKIMRVRGYVCRSKERPIFLLFKDTSSLWASQIDLKGKSPEIILQIRKEYFS